MPWLEQLSGMGSCSSAGQQVGWLTVSGGAGTLKPGQSAKVRVTLHAAPKAMPQPTVQNALLVVHEDTRFALGEMRVKMKVEAPDSWGRIFGTVSGRQRCGTPYRPVAGVKVRVNGRRDAVVRTGSRGGYSYWLPAGMTKVTAQRPGWPRDSDRVKVRPGRGVRADLRLRLHHGC